MGAKVYKDKDGKLVSEGSPEAAFIYNADDPRAKPTKTATATAAGDVVKAPAPQPQRRSDK